MPQDVDIQEDLSGANLEEELRLVRRTISTDGYQMSIGELINMYRDNELIIRPNFQRLFRWDDSQKSQLIESILLGIPLPSIFVAQDDDGNWELVDGLQRVSTLLQFQGILKSENEEPPQKLTLTSTKYLKHLDGVTWDGEGESGLSSAQKLDIKRAKIDVKIVKRESSKETKFDLFQRLNSFGSTLTPQEIRNAILVGENPEFVSWLQKLANRQSFLLTTGLSDRETSSKYDEELVLRFLWLHRIEDISGELQNFRVDLEAAAFRMATNFENIKEDLEGTFVSTFDQLAESSGEDSFRKWDESRGKFRNGFSNTAFEAIAMGLGYQNWRGIPARENLADAGKDLWRESLIQPNFATGKSTETRLKIVLPLGRQLMGQ